jgi:hypothetical protein
MATTVPNVSLNPRTLLGNLIGLLSTNFAATNTALSERVVGQRLTVPRYAATGATTTKMTLGITSPPGSTPWAVILVRAQEASDPGKDLSVSTRLNFGREGQTLYVYEPSGLSANTMYDLGFLVIFDG